MSLRSPHGIPVGADSYRPPPENGEREVWRFKEHIEFDSCYVASGETGGYRVDETARKVGFLEPLLQPDHEC
jgi:hypothetical protein